MPTTDCFPSMAGMTTATCALRHLGFIGRCFALAWLTAWLEATEGQKLVVFAHHRDIQARLAADLPGAVWPVPTSSTTSSGTDGLVCVTATSHGHGLPPLGAIVLSARSCALGGDQ